MDDSIKMMGNFSLPDQKKEFAKIKVDMIDLPTATVTREVFQPGWIWSMDMKPTAGKLSCQVHHIFVLLSGQFTIILDDGTEVNMSPGDVADIPPGHDARVIGNQPAVLIDFTHKEQS